jgi:tetratricopeptide (TPR) repeat protein
MANELSPGRKKIFAAILVIVVLLVPLLAWEAALRIIGAGVSDDPYLQLGPTYPFFVKRNIDGRQYYKVANRRLYRERKTVFPARKDPNTFRVFCLGESASAGWPHPSQEIYSAYLEEALVRAYPQHKIEVINVSAHSFPSYKTRQILQRILEFEPDLVVLWIGNAEFMEKRTYSSFPQGRWSDALVGAADRSVLFRTLRVNQLVRHWLPENTTPPEDDPYLWWSLLEQRPLELRTDSEQFEWVKKHYRFSIESMVTAAQRDGVPVILITVPVNLRDWRPNASYQPLQGDDLARWNEHYARGRTDLFRNDLASAISEFEIAKSLAPLHAETHFELARALEAQGRFSEARENFIRARDLDYNPSRTISAFNEVVRDATSRYDNAELVDADAIFQTASAPRAPGFDLFLDYVHPTKQGNLLIAKAVFDAIVKKHLVDGAATEGFSHQPQPYRCGREERLYLPEQQCVSETTPYDEARDFPMQVQLIRLFAMMNQTESVAAKVKLLSEIPGAMETLSRYHATYVKEAMDVYPKLVELERRALAGEFIESEWKAARKRLVKFQRKYYKGYEEYMQELGTPTPPTK